MDIEALLNAMSRGQLTDDPFKVKKEVVLGEEQQAAFEKVKNGKNTLIIAAAGRGKSKLIDYIRENISKKIYVSATTGISAFNISGITVHSLLGIGTGRLNEFSLLNKVRRNKACVDRIMAMELLIIDEASMLSASLFEKIDYIFKKIRRNENYFGGCQIVLSMDPLQLAAIFDKSEEDTRVLIESLVFKRCFKYNTVVLNKNYRQDDTDFSGLLDRLRIGEPSPEDIQFIESKKSSSGKGVELVGTNAKASSINLRNLGLIPGKAMEYPVSFSYLGKNEQVLDTLYNELASQLKQKALYKTSYKVSCRVILVRNIDVEAGLVNGSTGVILEMHPDFMLVDFDNIGQRMISRIKWKIDLDGCSVEADVLPLALAYSMTISKSQSLTLDTATLHLADCFCHSQVYVAMSRLKSINGLHIASFNPLKISVDKRMLDFVNLKR